MTDGSPPTRGEFTMLMQQVAENARAAAGLGMLQVQLAELVKDVAKLDGALESHEAAHVRDERDRARGRRQIVGLVIAAVAAIDGPLLTLLIDHVR